MGGDWYINNLRVNRELTEGKQGYSITMLSKELVEMREEAARLRGLEKRKSGCLDRMS